MHKTKLELFQPNFIVRTPLSQDGFISHPRPTKSIISRLLASLRIYSQDTSLLDSRLLQLKKCLSLIQLKAIIQWLNPLLYKDFVSFLYSYLLAKLKGVEEGLSSEVSSDVYTPRPIVDFKLKCRSCMKPML